MMNFKEMADARYSVRKFSSRPIEPEKLQKVLEIGNMAPTAKNIQPQRIYVLKSPEAMKKANALTPCIYGAPVCLVFTYDKDEVFHNMFDNTINSGDEDCSIAATYIMFAAVEEGLGTCWLNRMDPAAVKKELGLPENEQVVLMMPIGYPAPDSKPAPRHTEKKPLSATVREL